MALVKPNISERDGVNLDYGLEEIDPASDILRSAGIQVDEATKIQVLGGRAYPNFSPGVVAPIGSFYISTNGNIYRKREVAATGWWRLQSHPQWLLFDKVDVPVASQYVVHNRNLFLLGSGALWLGPGAQLIVNAAI